MYISVMVLKCLVFTLQAGILQGDIIVLYEGVFYVCVVLLIVTRSGWGNKANYFVALINYTSYGQSSTHQLTPQNI